MTHRKKIRVLFVVAVLLINYASIGQTLQFEDILKIYSSDSISVKQFCDDKKFNLKEVRDNGVSVSYKFEANDNNRITLEILFPKDVTTNSVGLNYWFDNKKDYSNFKKSFKTNGFVRQTINQVQAPFYTYAQRYLKDNLQIELIESKAKPPYWIFLHKAGKYN